MRHLCAAYGPGGRLCGNRPCVSAVAAGAGGHQGGGGGDGECSGPGGAHSVGAEKGTYSVKDRDHDHPGTGIGYPAGVV